MNMTGNIAGKEGFENGSAKYERPVSRRKERRLRRSPENPLYIPVTSKEKKPRGSRPEGFKKSVGISSVEKEKIVVRAGSLPHPEHHPDLPRWKKYLFGGSKALTSFGVLAFLTPIPFGYIMIAAGLGGMAIVAGREHAQLHLKETFIATKETLTKMFKKKQKRA